MKLILVISVILYRTFAQISNLKLKQSGTDEHPLCLKHSFTQSELLYGNLVRKHGSHGELIFMDGFDATETLEIFSRVHPDRRRYTIN